jgi:hypothetical protein
VKISASTWLRLPLRPFRSQLTAHWSVPSWSILFCSFSVLLFSALSLFSIKSSWCWRLAACPAYWALLTLPHSLYIIISTLLLLYISQKHLLICICICILFFYWNTFCYFCSDLIEGLWQFYCFKIKLVSHVFVLLRVLASIIFTHEDLLNLESDYVIQRNLKGL